LLSFKIESLVDTHIEIAICQDQQSKYNLSRALARLHLISIDYLPSSQSKLKNLSIPSQKDLSHYQTLLLNIIFIKKEIFL
jgi:hypothetical protein